MSLTQFCVLGASYPPLLMWHQFFFLLILLTTQGTETESHLDIHNLILEILRRNCSPKQHNVMPSTKEQRNFTDFCSKQSIWFSVPNHLKLQCWFFSILTLNTGLLSAHKFLSYCSQGHSDSTTLWSLLLVLTKLHSPRPMTRKVNNTLTCTKWSVKYVSSSFTPANGVYVWGFKIHKLELGLSIKEKLQHTTHDVCYGGHSNDVWLL